MAELEALWRMPWKAFFARYQEDSKNIVRERLERELKDAHRRELTPMVDEWVRQHGVKRAAEKPKDENWGRYRWRQPRKEA